MSTLADLDLSRYGERQPDLFRPPPKIFVLSPSPEAEHLDWCRRAGFTPLEIIESVGRRWPGPGTPDFGDALLALIRAGGAPPRRQRRIVSSVPRNHSQQGEPHGRPDPGERT